MPLGRHFKLSLKDCPVRDCNVERKSKVSYANAVRSLTEVDYEIFFGTSNVGLVYWTDRGNHMDVTCFVDSHYNKDPDKGNWLRILSTKMCCKIEGNATTRGGFVNYNDEAYGP
uniref:Uncharacterized protein n=1 Tax=Tanacetum cinerariifolium TaxID=118510 RepID=A0A6L2J7L8_TANCI|nr:hypothetical protein [Tanacetum cinerariifolium]